MVDLEEDPDLALSIPLKSIYEEFQCPICFSPIEGCYMTPCGHNFCKDCIYECLNRKHTCPSCNTPCTKDKLLKNHHYDRILSIIEQQKETASKSYFDSLLRSGEHPLDPADCGAPAQRSPIEALFHKHMKKSLVSYEEYFGELKKKFENRRKEVERLYDTKIKSLKKEYAGEEKKKTRHELLRQLKLAKEHGLAELDKSFVEASGLLLDNYDSYMSGFQPAPKFLPIGLPLLIEALDLRIEKVVVRQTDSLMEIRALVMGEMERRKDPVKEWSPDNVLVLRRPDHTEVPITDRERPILQYGPQPGDELVLRGSLRVESALPKKCFTVTFDKDSNAVMDYYTCKDCKINWVCKTCATTCHQGHQIIDYLTNHAAKFACCYCAKNKKCKIENNRK